MFSCYIYWACLPWSVQTNLDSFQINSKSSSNKEKKRQERKDYYQKNKEPMKKARKKYYQKNRERMIEINKKRYHKNKKPTAKKHVQKTYEEKKAYWTMQNLKRAEQLRAYAKKKYHADPKRARARTNKQYRADPKRAQKSSKFLHSKNKRSWAGFNLQKRVHYLTVRLRGRNKKRGVIDVDYRQLESKLEKLWVREYCVCCGVKYDHNIYQRKRAVDRIDNDLGYIAENIQIICHRCNLTKRDATAADIENIHRYILKHSPSLNKLR